MSSGNIFALRKLEVRTTSPLHFMPGTTPFQGGVMNWFILVVAGVFEIGWAIGLKYTEGFSRPWPTVGTLVSMILSVALLGITMKSLPVGTAYAVWVGVGAIGTAILGMFLFDEPTTPGRILSLMCIFAGIVGLRLPAS